MTLARSLLALPPALAAWNAARASHRSLSRLTERELADLGLHRGDIEVPALLRTR